MVGLRRKKTLKDRVDAFAGDVVDQVRPRAEAALDTTRDFVQDTALPALADARDAAADAAKEARKNAGPVLADARDKATPVLLDARDKAAAGLADARDKAAPVIASGAALAAERATQAKDAAEAKAAELRGEQKPKRSKLKVFLFLAALGGVAAVVARRLQGGSSSTDNWQTSYTPAPPPAPATPATPAAPQAGVEDPTGASPDEALADAAEAPREATTPDSPADVVDVEGDDKRG